MNKCVMAVVFALVLTNYSIAGEKLTPEQVVCKYNLSRNEQKDVWVYDQKQYGVMWYGHYNKDGTFHARFRRVNALADLRSLYPTNYRKYYQNRETVLVRFYGK